MCVCWTDPTTPHQCPVQGDRSMGQMGFYNRAGNIDELFVKQDTNKQQLRNSLSVDAADFCSWICWPLLICLSSHWALQRALISTLPSNVRQLFYRPERSNKWGRGGPLHHFITKSFNLDSEVLIKKCNVFQQFWYCSNQLIKQSVNPQKIKIVHLNY